MLFGSPSPRNWGRRGLALSWPARACPSCRSPVRAADAHSIGSLSRGEKEPTGANVRPVLLSRWVLRGGPAARTAAAAPGRATHRRPRGRRGVRRCRAWRRSGLGLRLRLFGAALLRRDALFLTGRRGFFPRLPLLRPRLRLLRLLRFLRHDRLPIFTASLLSLSPAQRALPLRQIP